MVIVLSAQPKLLIVEAILNYLIDIYYKLATFPLEGIVGTMFILFNVSVFLMILTVLFSSRVVIKNKRKTKERLTPKLLVFFKKVLCGKDIIPDNQIISEYNSIIGKASKFKTDIALEALYFMDKCEFFNHDNYNRMFELLSLDDYLIKRISFSSASTKYKILNSIKELEVKRLDSVVYPYKYNKNNRVRKEARLSYLLISDNDPYQFFEDLQDEITYWDTIELMRLLNKINEKGELQSLSKWLVNSNNESLSLFLVKAIAFFKQYTAKEVLIDMLDNENHLIRSEVIRALGVLKCVEIESLLIKKYYNEVTMCQKAIIKAIEMFDTGESLEFLKEQYYYTKEVDLEMEIAKTINNCSGGELVIKELRSNLKNGFKKLILNHVQTPIIKFKGSYA